MSDELVLMVVSSVMCSHRRLTQAQSVLLRTYSSFEHALVNLLLQAEPTTCLVNQTLAFSVVFMPEAIVPLALQLGATTRFLYLSAHKQPNLPKDLSLFVAGIPAALDQDSLQEAFSIFGAVTQVQLQAGQVRVPDCNCHTCLLTPYAACRPQL